MDNTLPSPDEPSVQTPSLSIKLPSDQPSQETEEPTVPTQAASEQISPNPVPIVQDALPPDPFDSFGHAQDFQSAQDKPFDNVAPVSLTPEPTTPQPTAFEPPLPPPPAPPTPIFENSASVKKGFPKIFLIAIIFAIIIGAAAAYYVSLTKNVRSAQQPDNAQKTPVTSPTEVPLPTVSPSENATPSPAIRQTGLKTYINSKYGFELSYPSAWKYSENINEYGSIKFFDPNKSIPNSSIGDVSITPYKTASSLNEWLDSGHPFFGKDLKKYYTAKQPTTVNGNSVTEMTGGNGSIYGEAAYLKSGGYVYELFLQGTAASIKSENMLSDDVFRKILSSLKFNP